MSGMKEGGEDGVLTLPLPMSWMSEWVAIATCWHEVGVRSSRGGDRHGTWALN
jgi:hypothetical protein